MARFPKNLALLSLNDPVPKSVGESQAELRSSEDEVEDEEDES